jgi:hypothetical protein
MRLRIRVMSDDELAQLELRFLERGYSLLVEQLGEANYKAEALSQEEPAFRVGPPPTGFGKTRIEAVLRCWGDLPQMPETERPEFP